MLIELFTLIEQDNALNVRFVFLNEMHRPQNGRILIPPAVQHIFGFTNNLQVSSKLVALRSGIAFPSENLINIRIFNDNVLDTPHTCIKATAQLAMALSQLVSRKTDPLTPAKIELLNMQSADNSDIHHTQMSCVVSAFGAAIFEDIVALIKQTVVGICTAYSLEFELSNESRKQQTTFDKSAIDRIKRTARALRSENSVTYIEYPDTTFITSRGLFEEKPGAVLYYNQHDLTTTDMADLTSPRCSSTVLLSLLINIITNK